MFQIFRSFFSESAISGGILVAVDATGYIVPCTSTGYSIGTVEPFGGNVDAQFDVNTNAQLPVNVRLFGPTRNVAITAQAPTGLNPSQLIYLGANGYGSVTGTVLIGVALTSIPAGQANGSLVEMAEVNGY